METVRTFFLLWFPSSTPSNISFVFFKWFPSFVV